MKIALFARKILSIECENLIKNSNLVVKLFPMFSLILLQLPRFSVKQKMVIDLDSKKELSTVEEVILTY